MRKLSAVLAVVGLTASLGAYATVPTTAAPFELVIPNLQSGFEFFVAGLYLEPSSNDNLNYAIVRNINTNFAGAGTQTTIQNNVANNNPTFGFGFEVGIGYIFANSGNDVQLSWMSYNHGSQTSIFTEPGQYLSSGTSFNGYNYMGIYNIGPTTFTVVEDLNAGNNVDEKINAIDLDVGQYIDFGTRLRVRFFGGLRAAQVEQDIQNTYHDMTDVLITNAAGTNLAHLHYKDDLKQTFESQFRGLGPLMGIKTSYNVWNCFGVTALVDTAMLVGKVDTTTNTWQRFNLIDNNTNTPVFPEVFPININSTSSDDIWRVVPAVDAKLGVNYSYLFRNSSTLTFEAGYQTNYYFDAADKVDAFTGERHTSSVAYSGPYASLNYSL